MVTGIGNQERDDRREQQRLLAGNAWWAAFEAGRLINRLRWALLQDSFLRDDQLEEEVQRCFQELGSKVLVLASVDICARLKSGMLDRLEEWRKITGTREYGESAFDACHKYRLLAMGEEMEDDFDDVAGGARRFAEDAESIVLEAIGEREELRTIFLLGQFIDQGVRPPITTTSVFRLVPNRERYRMKRNRSDRRALAIPSGQRKI